MRYGDPEPESWAASRDDGPDTADDQGQAAGTFGNPSVNVEHMFDERYRAVRWVDPPIEVSVLASRLWAPRRLNWGADTPLWQRSAGLRIEEEIPGRLEELVITSAGDLVGRVRFAPIIERRRSAEVMLLPWGTWVVSIDEDERRLRGLVADFGFARRP